MRSILLLQSFAPTRLSPWNPVRENAKLPKRFLMLRLASSLAQLGQKKAKNAIKKIVVTKIQHVPSAFSDDEMTEEP
jgi:hypothetical protein